jgi:hypothetical protein
MMGSIITYMVAVRKKWVLLIDLPFAVRELVAEGYRSFRMEAGEDTKRVELRAWKGPRTTKSRRTF